MGETTVRVGQRWHNRGLNCDCVVMALLPNGRVRLDWQAMGHLLGHADDHWKVSEVLDHEGMTLLVDAPAEVKPVERDWLDTSVDGDGYPMACIVCGTTKSIGLAFGCEPCWYQRHEEYVAARDEWQARQKARKEGAVTGNSRPPGTGTVPPPPSGTCGAMLGYETCELPAGHGGLCRVVNEAPPKERIKVVGEYGPTRVGVIVADEGIVAGWTALNDRDRLRMRPAPTPSEPYESLNAGLQVAIWSKR